MHNLNVTYQNTKMGKIAYKKIQTFRYISKVELHII